MVNFLAVLGRFFGVVGGVFGKASLFLIGTKFGRRGIILAFVLLAIFFQPVKEAFNQGTPEPVIDTAVTRLASGDNGINQEVDDFIKIPEKGLMDILKSVWKLFGYFYFSFLIIGWFFWKIADFQDDTHDLRNILFTIFMLLALQVGGSIYLLSSEHEGSFSEDLLYIIGDKSLTQTIKFLNPIKGIINLVTNLDAYLEPIATLSKQILKE